MCPVPVMQAAAFCLEAVEEIAIVLFRNHFYKGQMFVIFTHFPFFRPTSSCYIIFEL